MKRQRSACFGMNLFLLMSVIAATDVRAADVLEEELAPSNDVTFKARWDGSEQRYVVRLPKNFDARRPHDLLIALHGHGSDRWQFAKDARSECRAARDCASKHQMIFVSPDYRATTSWMGPAADADLLQVIDELHQSYRIENVVVCGGSMGGTSALAFATMHPQIVDGVVSMNGTANLLEYPGFADAIAASYGGNKLEKPDVYKVRSAELFPERLTMPIGLTTGGRDTLVPPDSTLRLEKLLALRQAPVKLIHRPDGGHETSYADGLNALQYVIEKIHADQAGGAPLLTFDREPRTIVCLGDSVTGVYYHTGGRRAYPEMLQLALNQLHPNAAHTVVNAGISGHATQNGLDRLEQDVLSKKPDLVTISFGLNDVVRTPPDTFRSNLEQLVRRCRERKSHVLLCTPNAVIETSGRPVEKVAAYCEIIRTVGREMSVPVCDQFQAGNRLKQRAPWAWRLTMSDEIHPNMDGHKRMAEELCRSLTGQTISLDPIEPPRPSLPHTRALLKQKRSVRVLAMSPCDNWIGAALKGIQSDATVEVTTWSVTDKSMVTLEKEANQLVRSMKPDLVVLAVPSDASAESDEQFVRSYSWIMNWSLSFGFQEWDCVVVHPSVIDPKTKDDHRDGLCRRLVRAQDLDMIDRGANHNASSSELFSDWFVRRLNE